MLFQEEIIMNIIKETNGRKLTVKIEGRLDTSTAPELSEVLDNSLSDFDSLVLDLAKLEYVSSAGLRVILSAHKKMSAKEGMAIINSSEAVHEIFDITGFSDILNIG